jgi:hypothetical protein
MDLQVGRERANRWKGLAWLKLAANEGLRGRKDHLVEDGFSGLECESEQCHSDNVTDVTVTCQTIKGTGGDGQRGRCRRTLRVDVFDDDVKLPATVDC